MQQTEVSSGFTDLLSEFKKRTRTPTDIHDLKLGFQTSHDFYFYTVEEGTTFTLMLAVFNPGSSHWAYFLTSGTPARKMVEELCQEYGFGTVAEALDEEFKEFKKLLVP